MSLQGPPSMHSFQLQGSVRNLFARFEGREQRYPEALSTGWCWCCSALNLQQMDHQMQVLRFVTLSLAAFGSKRRTLVEHRILPQKDWTEQSQSLFTLSAPDFAQWRPADHVHLIFVSCFRIESWCFQSSLGSRAAECWRLHLLARRCHCSKDERGIRKLPYGLWRSTQSEQGAHCIYSVWMCRR